MHKSAGLIAGSFVLGLILTVPTAFAKNPNPGVLPPHAGAYGMTYGEWSAAWWEWVTSFPADQNPLVPEVEVDCELGQAGPVWFIAGTTGGTAVRTCTVPAGKAIFFPIVNYLNDYPCPDPTFQPAPGQSLEDFLTEGANFFIDQVSGLEVEVDGAPLQNLFDYRATSELFTFTGDPSLVAFDACITGTPQSGVSDGYWVLLRPLAVGEHTIHFSGEIEVFGFEMDTTYHLTVAPHHSH